MHVRCVLVTPERARASITRQALGDSASPQHIDLEREFSLHADDTRYCISRAQLTHDAVAGGRVLVSLPTLSSVGTVPYELFLSIER